MNESNEDDLLLSRVRLERHLWSLPRFSRTDALALGEAILAVARAASHPVTVRVERGEQLVFHAALEGTTAEHDGWVQRKAMSARTYEVPSVELVLRQRTSGRKMDWLDPQRFAVAGGAIPVLVDGTVAGVVAVSGMVGSIMDDHDLVLQALRSMRDITTEDVA